MERDWENLPKHLLDSVVEKLLIAPDYLGFSLVCKSWYSVAKYNKSKHATMTAPLLVFYTRRKDYWKVYNVVERKVLDFQVRMPNRGLVGSSKGWLIFVHRNDADKTFGLTLVNPFLRVRGRKPKENSLIRLPPLKAPDWEQFCWRFVTRATISADPILDANNCIVMASHMHRNTLAFIRLGKDTTWTYVEKSVPNAVCGCGMIEEIANVGNKIYTLNYWSELVSFDVTSRSYSDVKLVSRGFQPDRYQGTKRYMFEGEDHKLLMIHRYIKATKVRRTTRFTVFEFNFQTGEWTKKNTLGNVAVFVGDNASVCVLDPNSFGFQSNCIYFNHDHDYLGNHHRAYDFGLYNVEDQSFPESYTDEAIDLLENSYPLPIWVVPTLTFPL